MAVATLGGLYFLVEFVHNCFCVVTVLFAYQLPLCVIDVKTIIITRLIKMQHMALDN